MSINASVHKKESGIHINKHLPCFCYLINQKLRVFNSLLMAILAVVQLFFNASWSICHPQKLSFFRAGQRKHLPSLCENLTQVGSSRISCTKYYHNFNCTVVYSSQEDILCYKFSSKFAGMVSFLKSLSWFS